MNKKKYFLSDSEIEIIKRHYDGTTTATDRIMGLMGNRYPRWFVKRQAQLMGFAKCKEPNWSEKEIEYLHENYPKKSMQTIQRGLKRINGGRGRSVTAIVLKKRRMGINKRSDGFTMRMVEELLGTDHHRIQRWIQLGWLVDRRKGTERKKIQGGDMHHFEAKDLRTLVVDHPFEIDLRRVERVSFIQLISGLL